MWQETGSHTVAESRRTKEKPYGNASRTSCCRTSTFDRRPAGANSSGDADRLEEQHRDHRRVRRFGRRGLPDDGRPSRGRPHEELLVPRGVGQVHRRLRASASSARRPSTRCRSSVSEIEASLVPLPNQLGEAIAEYQASVEARQRAEVGRRESRRRLRPRRAAVACGSPAAHLDLNEAIEEHKSAARSRRSREADGLGLEWLFERDARAARGLRCPDGRRAGSRRASSTSTPPRRSSRRSRRAPDPAARRGPLERAAGGRSARRARRRGVRRPAPRADPKS